MSVPNSIPYFDLNDQFAATKSQWIASLEKLGESGSFILGSVVDELESKIAEYLGVRHAVTVASGTDALVLALRAVGVKSGDSVIVPAFTFYATAEAVSLIGANPKFVDIQYSDFNIDPNLVEAAVDDSVKAILPVHLFGAPANMSAIDKISKSYGIPVVEDAAQAFGASIGDRRVGTLGTAGGFSFYPTKILGAYGDGGMVVTNDDAIADHLKLLRNHGISGPNIHDLIGYTSRLDAIQALILSIKLESVDDSIKYRRTLARRYYDQLRGSGLVLPTAQSDANHAYNIYTVRSTRREEIKKVLSDNRVGYQIYYPIPIYQQRAYLHLGLRDEQFPESVRACREAISLPLYPEMSEQVVDRIANIINQASM